MARLSLVVPCPLLREGDFQSPGSSPGPVWEQPSQLPHPNSPPCAATPATPSCRELPLHTTTQCPALHPLLQQCSSCPFTPDLSTVSCEIRFPGAFPVPSPAELGDPFPCSHSLLGFSRRIGLCCTGPCTGSLPPPPTLTQAALSMSGGGGAGLLHLPQPSSHPSRRAGTLRTELRQSWKTASVCPCPPCFSPPRGLSEGRRGAGQHP